LNRHGFAGVALGDPFHFQNKIEAILFWKWNNFIPGFRAGRARTAFSGQLRMKLSGGAERAFAKHVACSV
jgi:hypothetical protein